MGAGVEDEMTPENAAFWAKHKRLIRQGRARKLRREGHRWRGGLAKVRCWWCGATAWRRWYTWSRVVGRATRVRDFGRCFRARIWRSDAFSGHPPMLCEGSMHILSEAKFVSRAAYAWDRKGYNRTSEHDR